MKPGAGKRKGGNFERRICKQLSLWLSNNQRTDILWRSSISGGRATVAHKKGIVVRQAGDICSVAPEGHDFCDRFFVECKHRRDLSLDSFLLKHKGPLTNHWKKTCQQAERRAQSPMMICQSSGPIFVVTGPNVFEFLPQRHIRAPGLRIFLLDEMLKYKWPHASSHHRRPASVG